mgnify:CR=1 FL=1
MFEILPVIFSFCERKGKVDCNRFFSQLVELEKLRKVFHENNIFIFCKLLKLIFEIRIYIIFKGKFKYILYENSIQSILIGSVRV